MHRTLLASGATHHAAGADRVAATRSARQPRSRDVNAPGRLRPSARPVIQRCACGDGGAGECVECRAQRLHAQAAAGLSPSHRVAASPALSANPSRRPVPAPAPGPAGVRGLLGRGGGQPLAAAVRSELEHRLSADFSDVRIHTAHEAAVSAAALNASAYTVGSQIVFGAGAFAPATSDGRLRLAHELVHVIQQRSGPVSGTEIGDGLALSDPSDRFERQADTLAAAAMAEPEPAATLGRPNTRRARSSARPLAVQRQNANGGGAAPVAAAPTVPAPSNSAPGAGIAETGGAGVEATPTDTDAGGAGGMASAPRCTPDPGIPPTDCRLYSANAYWLPTAYVINATCACTSTPNVPTANCVRQFLQDRLRATPGWLIAAATVAKLDPDPATYEAFVQTVLTPRIYGDHVDAYRHCCCPYGPAPYYDWIGVTTVPIPICPLVGWTIAHFGSCTGTPGAW
jgi:hypothetical protein